jgi:hypothetical protein
VTEHRPERDRAPADRGRRRLLWWGGAGSLIVVLIAAAGWLAWTAGRARAELLAARGELPAVRAAVLTGDGSGTRRMESVTRHARAADSLTHDPLWSAVGALPWIGSPIATTGQMTRSVRTLAEQGMPALVTAADTLHPARLVSDGRLDVAGLQRAEPALAKAARTLRTQRDAVVALDPSWFGPVTDAHAQLSAELTSLAEASSAAADAARVVPPMLGVGGPRRYFVAFQNPAEARASGGLLDAFAIIVADAGSVRVERIGANTQLPPLTEEITDVDPGFIERYGSVGATSAWLEANVSPHFPDVATAWAQMWRQATGQQIDGAVALTPKALAAVLAATGPVQAPGIGSVDAGRIENLVLHEQYVLPGLGEQRKSLMLGVGKAALDALLAGRVSPDVLLPGLRSAAREGYVLVHSRMPDEEAELVAGGVAGAVDASARPYAQVVIVNAAGNKLDSWLGSSLDYRVTSCSRTERTVQVTVALRNDAPTSGLPAYVTVRSDAPAYPVRPSQNRSQVEVLLTRGAKLRQATLDGRPLVEAPPPGELPDELPGDASATFLEVAKTRGRPSYSLDLELVPGTPRTLVLTVTEPPSNDPPLLPRQVMVKPQVVRSELKPCPPPSS